MASDDPLPPPAPLPPPTGRPAANAPAAGVDDRRLLAAPTRQSPLALVFIAWRFVRRLGLSALAATFVFVVNGGITLAPVFAVAAIALLVASTLSWWRFTFVVDDGELVVTKGVLSVERLVIPLERVQSVAIDERLVHRLVGLVSAGVDTAGSAGVEFEIDAIDRTRAEALRRVAADARVEPPDHGVSIAEPALPVEDVVLRRTFGDLLLVGLTRVPWAGLVALAPLIALADELSRFDMVGDRFERLADRTSDPAVGSFAAGILVAAVAIVALTVIGLVLQVIREIFANWDLTLRRTPTGGLRRTAGLLSTTSRSSTARRIQIITTDDSPPQRRLGITHLRLRAFGDNGISLPGTPPAEVAMLRGLVFGVTEPPPLDRTISRWYVFRRTRNAAIQTVVVSALLWFAIGWWALLGLVLVPLRWAAARRRWRLRRWGLDRDRLAESYTFLARHTGELPLFKAQSVSVTQSWFERRKGLATVEVRTAGGHLSIPMIDRDAAMAVRDRVLDAVETDRRRPF